MSSITEQFNQESQLIFHATPYQGGVVPFAVLGFCWIADRIILAKVKNRGWCVPSGRIEASETPLQAVAREAEEECGIRNAVWLPFGWFEVNEQQLCRVSLAYVCADPVWDGKALGEDVVSTETFRLDELAEIYYDWNAVTAQAIETSLKAATRLR